MAVTGSEPISAENLKAIDLATVKCDVLYSNMTGSDAGPWTVGDVSSYDKLEFLFLMPGNYVTLSSSTVSVDVLSSSLASSGYQTGVNVPGYSNKLLISYSGGNLSIIHNDASRYCYAIVGIRYGGGVASK